MKKNLYPFMLLAMVCVAAFPPQVIAQQHDSPDREGIGGSEQRDDHYTPNRYGNQRTSPALRYTLQGAAKTNSTTIFTQQANVDAAGLNILGDAANEPSIAVNPLNENQIAIGWRQFDDVSSNFRQAGTSYSTDGGHTWSPIFWIEQGVFRSDPVLRSDKNGNFFYNSLSINPNYACKVFGSTDSGANWDVGVDAQGGDKQWMAIDRGNGVGAGNIYASWSEAFSACAPDLFTRSTNGNITYDNCTYVSGSPWRGTIAVGPNGEVYIGAMSYATTDSVMVAKSTDAQVANAAITWTTTTVFMDGALVHGLPINPGGLPGQMNIDVDRSGGIGNGNVYLMAPLTRFSNGDPGDVMFVRSTDGGSTWSAPLRVNDDISTSNMQWLATLSVAPNGRIDAAWLDTRDNPGGDSSALYFSYSLDQGQTWSANEKLSNVFDPHTGYPNQNKMGDYFDMFSTNSGANLAWTGTLNGEEDVYFSHIVPAVLVGTEAIPAVVPFSFFPNPSDGKLVVQTPLQDAKLLVLNAVGEEVYATALQQGITELDLAVLPAGMYFLRVVGADGSVSLRKLIRD